MPYIRDLLESYVLSNEWPVQVAQSGFSVKVECQYIKMHLESTQVQ